MYVTQKKNFLHSIFTLQVGNMLNFIVGVLETKKSFNTSFSPVWHNEAVTNSALEKHFIWNFLLFLRQLDFGIYTKKNL